MYQKVVGYNDDDNARRAVRAHVAEKYGMRLEDVKNVLRPEVNIDMVLFKEPGLYCFLLRCKKPKAKPFMEWVMETDLPQQDWKSASAIEERDAALALIHDDLRDRDNQIQAIDTARKTIFPRSWNIIESSKTPCKYDLSINFLPKKDRISHHRIVQNKNFSVTSKYHVSINFLTQKRTVFPITEKLKSSKQEILSNQ